MEVAAVSGEVNLSSSKVILKHNSPVAVLKVIKATPSALLLFVLGGGS